MRFCQPQIERFGRYADSKLAEMFSQLCVLAHTCQAPWEQGEKAISPGRGGRIALSKRVFFRRYAAPTPHTPSTPFHKYDHVCDEGFLPQTRRERRGYPSGVCKA